MAGTDAIHLLADLSLIHTLGKWRQSGVGSGHVPYGDPQPYLDLARRLEKGLFDGVFFADVAGTPMFEGSPARAVEWGVAWPRHDPLPMAIAMSCVTRHLGFVSTMSMTYHHPFAIARLLSSVDHVTRGRIGYNAVVSGFPQEAQNYGYDTAPDHTWRYERAGEFLEVLDKLWSSVEPDAMLWDHATGRVADPAKVRCIDHQGTHFNVMGPLPCAPSPQGRPIQFQAGASKAGMALAGRWADIQFATIGSLEGMRRHRADLDTAAIAAGRDPQDVGIMWSARFDVVSGPEEEAHNRQRFIDSIPEEMALVFLGQWWGIDEFELDPRQPVHETIARVREEAIGANWSYLDESERVTGPTTSVAQHARERLAPDQGWNGTACQIADWMEEAHEAAGRNGGFILAPRSGAQGAFNRFIHEVVPELQRRGLMRREYAGRTLRENLLG